MLGYVAALRRESGPLQSILKPIPVLCLLVWLLPPQSAYGVLIMVGLAFSALGDVLLRGKGQRSFLFGLLAFLVAHLAYISAFLYAATALQFWLAVPFALYGTMVLWRLWPRLGRMRWPVTLYVGIICALMWRAAACVGAHSPARPGSWLAFGGAVLFAASDTLLAVYRFVKPLRSLRYVYILLYWAAQVGIAYSARPWI